MALRGIRLVIPAGSVAFKSANVAQKVRTEKKADMELYLFRETLQVYKDTLTQLVSFLAASITVGHQPATSRFVYDVLGRLDPSESTTNCTFQINTIRHLLPIPVPVLANAVPVKNGSLYYKLPSTPTVRSPKRYVSQCITRKTILKGYLIVARCATDHSLDVCRGFNFQIIKIITTVMINSQCVD